jgi:glycosyltransferase involved in cell wall biosynthesis
MWAPLEIIMSRFNDILVTINWEDYNWAKKHTYTPVIEHIDGIGVDSAHREILISGEEKRAQLGFTSSDILVLSVGELQKRKNHEVIIKAIAKINNPNIKYIICCQGVLEEYLSKLSESLNLQNQVSLLGYRQDIPEIMNACDIFAHPSVREGLGLASLEAMAVGLPLITSNVQGVPDYIESGITGYMCSPRDVDTFAKNINILVTDETLRRKIAKTNVTYVQKYLVEEIQPVIKGILDNCTEQKETITVN